MKRFDVAVIGLGAMGSAALYQLSKQGVSLIGIDMYAPPHSLGSSHGESRVTRQAIGEGSFYTPMVLRANEIWNELEGISGQELFNHCGMLIAAHEEQRFLRNTLGAAKEYDIKHRLLESAEAERLFPALNVANKDHVLYYEPTSGFLRPERCIDVQLKLAQQNGAEILSDTSVTVIQEITGGVEVRLKNGETIIATKVVIASGPWIKEMLHDNLSHILKTLLQTLYWFDIDPRYYETLIPGKMPVFLCGDEKSETTRSFYGFPILNGPAGGIKFAVHESDREISPDSKDSVEPVTSGEEIYAFISRYLRGVTPKVLRSANCLYTMTPDENFIIDFKPGSERIVFSSACSGHGFKHSAAIGEVLSQLVVGQAPTIDISAFKLNRFAHLSNAR